MCVTQHIIVGTHFGLRAVNCTVNFLIDRRGCGGRAGLRYVRKHPSLRHYLLSK